MPELPDLEVFSRNLNRRIGRQRLDTLTLSSRAQSSAGAARLRKALAGAQLRSVMRDGKELHFHFGNGHVLALHLMLHGRLYWQQERPEPHTLLTLAFANGRVLALADFQHKARITLDPEPAEAPDALSKQVNLSFWKRQLQRKARIKNLLLDPKVVRGIGNAYADEILWEARISPFSTAAAIPPEAVRALARAVPKVLKQAQRQILRLTPDAIGGEERSFLAIHHTHKKTSPTGAAIRQRKSGRITYYTDEQQLYT